VQAPTGQAAPLGAQPIQPTLGAAVWPPRQRRPTGAAPPMPYKLRTSGVGWLAAALVLVCLTLAVSGPRAARPRRDGQQ
jgi:hypothetical protein